MRKNIFLLLCTLFFFSCEQEDMLETYMVGEKPVTRSGIEEVDIPSVIDQLEEIPVNIKSVANNKYLSAKSSGSTVYLVDRDDGSLRQRWNIITTRYTVPGYSYCLTLVGGNSTFKKPYMQGATNKGRTTFYPSLQQYLPSNNTQVAATGDGWYYLMTMGTEYLPNTYPPLLAPIFFQPKTTSSTTVIASDNNYKGNLTKWEIIPVDEFRIDEISYYLTTNDRLSVIPTQIAIKTLVNNTDIPVTRTLSFQETVTNESSFSETYGMKIANKISSSYKISIPKFADGNYTNETSTEQTWSFTIGQKETQSYTIAETLTQEIPARTTVEAKLIATKYDASMTYVAKLYGLSCKKTIYLKGKWDGAVVKESQIVLSEKGKVLRTIKLKE